MEIRKDYNELPDIHIDECKMIITISGKSIPEEGYNAWFPFIRKLREHLKEWDKITINFQFSYYNTASTAAITTIMKMLSENQVRMNIVINWYYKVYDSKKNKFDSDMMEAGEEYRELYNFDNFNIISV